MWKLLTGLVRGEKGQFGGMGWLVAILVVAGGIAAAIAIPLAIHDDGEHPVEASPEFSASPTNGTAPLTVQFTDQSTGDVYGWKWDFDNDGQVDSTAQNPSHTYSTPGTYTVSLTVVGDLLDHTMTKTDHITVIAEQAVKTWHHVSSFSGTGNMTTAPFDIPGDEFRITWSATPDSTVALEGAGGAFSFKVYPEGETSLYVGSVSESGIKSTRTGTEPVNTGKQSFYIVVQAYDLREAPPGWSIEVESYH